MEGNERTVRTNKEFKIDSLNPISLKYGSLNYYEPEVVYINGSAFIKPFVDSDDYPKDINKVIKLLKMEIYEFIRRYSYFEDNYILNFDLKENSLKKNKKSFLYFELFLRQIKNNGCILPLSELTDVIIQFVDDSMHKMCDDFKDYGFEIIKRG